MSVALAHNSTEVAQYTPASALVVGKTLTERKVSVLHGATFEAIQVPSSKRATLTQVVELIQGVREMAAKIA